MYLGGVVRSAGAGLRSGSCAGTSIVARLCPLVRCGMQPPYLFQSLGPCGRCGLHNTGWRSPARRAACAWCTEPECSPHGLLTVCRGLRRFCISGLLAAAWPPNGPPCLASTVPARILLDVFELMLVFNAVRAATRHALALHLFFRLLRHWHGEGRLRIWACSWAGSQQLTAWYRWESQLFAQSGSQRAERHV